MTLILTVNGPETIWMLADRRLSYPDRPPKDDGRKLMFLDTKDGGAILGYAGLGATAKGTEPADWMSAVLRGHNLPLERSLEVLATAFQKQLPKHLLRMSSTIEPSHSVYIPAILNGEVRFYIIDIALNPDRKTYKFRHTRYIVTDSQPPRTPRLAIGGSGAYYLNRDRTWIRDLLHLVRAYDEQKVTPTAIADYLASLNYKVHRELRDNTVGPRCIIAWRNKKSGVHKSGGEHRHYTGLTADKNSPMLPTISCGMDIKAVIETSMPHILAAMPQEQAPDSAPPLDGDALNADLARLPEHPDEELR
jgi:hypothetical protein